MGKLLIESTKFKKQFNDIAKAVYNSLNQQANLKAEIIFMSAKKMQELNKSSRGVDKVTDVLSFPTLDGIRDSVIDANDFAFDVENEELFIGSIVLCQARIKEQAQELGHSEERERIYLTVHGLMHLFGHDHIDEEDKKIMRKREKSALKILGIED